MCAPPLVHALTLVSAIGGCANAPAVVSGTVVTREVMPGTPACASASGVAVQILGSGGPIPDDARASAGYLVWHDGRARVLVDAGGGTFERFGHTGAQLGTIDAIALTHLHTDHSADLATFVKGMFFMRRRDAPIALAGPTGQGIFPGLKDFARSMFDFDSGAYRYLGWALEPGKGSADLDLHELPISPEVNSVVAADDLVIDAIGVRHGPVPAVAYRVKIDGKTIVFGGDQNGDNPQFVEFARGADVLVMHHAIPENSEPVAAHLHARPSEIAEVARNSGAARLVLSHHMQRSLRRLDHALDLIAKRYEGAVIVGEDLMCIEPEQVAQTPPATENPPTTG